MNFSNIWVIRDYLMVQEVRTQLSHCQGGGLVPGQGIMILQSSVEPKNKQTNKNSELSSQFIWIIIQLCEHFFLNYTEKLWIDIAFYLVNNIVQLKPSELFSVKHNCYLELGSILFR